MGDPFSVAGSAVGVISLGLSICQGLLAYYGPFKAYDEQIHDVSNRITSFDSTLKALEDVLAHAQVFSSPLTAQSATVALDSIFACQEGLERLSKMLERCKGTASAKSFLGSKIQINRILYPFRRDTLMAILETVSWLQAHLNTSLQILNMSVHCTRERVCSSLTENIKGDDGYHSKADRYDHHVFSIERPPDQSDFTGSEEV
jgi:hypothetical protein